MNTIIRFFAILLAIMSILPSASAAETVSWRQFTVDTGVTELDLGKTEVYEWEPFIEFISQLPDLKRVYMPRCNPSLKMFARLHELFPDVDFIVTLRYGRFKLRTDDTAFSTLYAGGDEKFGYEYISLLRYDKNLLALDVGHQPIRDLTFLYDMPELRVLIVAICELTDITPIASLEHLEYLELFHNGITDISPLASLDHLIDLNLVRNAVSDLTPLMGLKNLRRLWIHDCDINNKNYPDEEILDALRAALPECHIDSESSSTGGRWRHHHHYQTLMRMFKSRVYEPFDDSDPDNLPEGYKK